MENSFAIASIIDGFEVASAANVAIMTSATNDFAVAPSFETLVLDDSTLPLERVSYIYYPLYFKKNQADI